jgi:hypothetical protein
MYLKSLSFYFFEKKSFKMSHITEKNHHLSGNNFKKPRVFLKSLTSLIIKSLHFSENVFKKAQNRTKRLTLLEKAAILFKYFKKASDFFKNASHKGCEGTKDP